MIPLDPIDPCMPLPTAIPAAAPVSPEKTDAGEQVEVEVVAGMVAAVGSGGAVEHRRLLVDEDHRLLLDLLHRGEPVHEVGHLDPGQLELLGYDRLEGILGVILEQVPVHGSAADV